MHLNKPKKIIVGMSGGVDSAVAAAILKKKGYEVTGVFLMLPQCKKEPTAIKDVKEICKILKIKLKIVDARKRFENTVIKYFLREYEKGRTPNPCVFCNENFKFKLLFEEAEKKGANYIATGHYAKIKLKTQSAKLKTTTQNSKLSRGLFQGIDKNKDQSYFLYRLKQKDLSRIIFPLGNYKKEKVKELAMEMKLPVLEKKESQDVCFLYKIGVDEFLKKNLKLKAGKIMDTSGKAIGSHSGLALYTLGQRKGINIGGTGPHYVLGKDYAKTRLIVTNSRKNLSLFSCKAALKEVNWILEKPEFPVRLLARTRYRNPLVYATISKKKEYYAVEFEKAQRAVTPGQSVVFYGKDGEAAGGGIIS